MAGVSHARLARADTAIRVGMTPAFLNDQHALLADWRTYLQDRLGMSVQFVQRDSYRETMDLLRQGRMEFAWLCDYPFIVSRNLVRLVVTPLNQGRPYYRSYLIVGADDEGRRSMTDLRNCVFAYADPYSNTGYLAPRFRIRRMGEDPARFFRKTFFTWSHRKVIEAVAKGYANGGAVDSFVWESLHRIKPDAAGRTRIIERSPEYGFPPIVAHRSIPTEMFASMQNALLGMSGDAQGRALLGRLNLDRFVVAEMSIYDGVVQMMRAFGEY